MVSGTVRLLCLTSLLPLVTSFSLVPVAGVRAQIPIPTQPAPAAPQDQPEPDNMRPMVLDNSVLSLQGGKRLMDEASQAVASQNYDRAAAKLIEARQVFNQLSNFYQELGSSFSGLDNRISDSLRKKALDTAQMRDQATYQLALVHRAQNKPELAVPLLIQIIRSQQPTRELGQKAYQQLFELGFVDSPFPRPRAGAPSSSATPAAENASQK